MVLPNARTICFLPLSLAAWVFAAPAYATLDQALSTGDPRLLPTSDTDIITAALQQIDGYRLNQTKMMNAIYTSTGAISYAPGNSTQIPQIGEQESVFPLLVGNQGKTLAVYGTAGSGRFAAYGSVPTSYFVKSSNLAYEEPFKRVLDWLLTGTLGNTTSLSQSKNIGITYLGNTSLNTWFSQKATNWKTEVCNTPATVSTCYQNKDLLIIGRESSATASDDALVLSAIKAHLALKKPVLYLHTGWNTSNFSDIVTSFLGFSLPYGGNYWANDAANFTTWNAMMANGDPWVPIQRLLAHFQAKDYNFNWASCTDDRDCKNMPDLVSEFYNGAEAVKQQVGAWEKKNLDVFSQTGRKLGKLLVLLGDKYRSTILYPMTKGVTNNTTFLQSLYADHTTYIARKINPAQPDLKGFSKTIPSTLAVKNVTLTLNTQASSVSSTSGYYAPPGRTITLTRKDTKAAKAYVHIGMLRTGASHVFATYDRPMFLWSTSIPLETNKVVNVTTPYGGIIFLNAEGSVPTQQIQVAATGVLQQPVFNGSNLSEFTTLLASTPLNWAEIKMPGLEIHSRLDLMQQSVSAPLINGNLNRLVTLTQTYLYNDIYNLAGLVGTGLTQSPTVLNFCTAHGWDCTSTSLHGISNIQHVNADRANCGYGCSGNPYDQYWAYEPLGWGESHEIGHNLQRGRLKIYDGASTEVSNNIFPTHKWWRFNKLTTETIKYGRDLGFKKTFDALQLAAKAADPIESARQAIWVNGGVFQRLVFYWQLAMSNSTVAALGDSGWDVFRLLYLQERLFSNAITTDTLWAAQRTNLGFGQYVQRPTTISSNDFMLIATSYITGKDQRAFFDLWGIKYSVEASNQVAAYGFPAVKKEFWVVPNETKAFTDPLAKPVLIDGVSAWPL